ncbi:MAG: hypothetical protein B6242_08575 [Anaerolineaceae bacterium 4572_78]|nr:MAG: hypothetical protein B6242_08575 [Anaerolineaceae bacterium 4572_78]
MDKHTNSGQLQKNDKQSSHIVRQFVKHTNDIDEKTALKKLDALLSGLLYRGGCSTPNDLLLYQSGLLAQSERKSVQVHLKTCLHCRQELTQIANGIAIMPQPSILEQMTQPFKRVLQAIFVSTPKPAFALRGDEKQESMYQTEEHQIVLTLEPPMAEENMWQLEGQVLPSGDTISLSEEGMINLVNNGNIVSHDVIDDFGYFSLENIEAGQYSLQLKWQMTCIAINELNIS